MGNITFTQIFDQFDYSLQLNPEIGVFSAQKPFDSPDVYNALVWDRNT